MGGWGGVGWGMRTSAGTASQGLLGDESVTGAAGVGWGMRASVATFTGAAGAGRGEG